MLGVLFLCGVFPSGVSVKYRQPLASAYVLLQLPEWLFVVPACSAVTSRVRRWRHWARIFLWYEVEPASGWQLASPLAWFAAPAWVPLPLVLHPTAAVSAQCTCRLLQHRGFAPASPLCFMHPCLQPAVAGVCDVRVGVGENQRARSLHDVGAAHVLPMLLQVFLRSKYPCGPPATAQ